MLGVIANPASGKDIRRLIAGASVFDNQEKRNIVRRAAIGALAAGERSFVYLPDGHGIARAAFDDAGAAGLALPLPLDATDSAHDTRRAAAAMRQSGCGAVLVLGGDGTNRAAAAGWLDLPVVAVSTGTNNVFPAMVEGTLAGLAGALVSTGAVDLALVARRAKAAHVRVEDERDDLALVDVALIEGPFVGSRAVWDPAAVREIVLTRAEPASVGLSAIGAFLEPLTAEADAALRVEVGMPGLIVRAPIAPGLVAAVPVRTIRRLELGEETQIVGPGVLAFDGERERRLRAGQRATVTVLRDGPWVIDVAQVLAQAACAGLFREGGEDGD